ncbi:MAG TPA: hypothetical protein VG838_15710 [Opitutaceae bacterium]|nr:hypothetical protein [Opitutaceae bacterium]
MSLDIFVDSFREGEPAGVSRDAVRSAFGRFVADVDQNCWRLRYDDTNFCDVDLSADEADPKKIGGFMISGPCGDERLWDALVSILKLGALVLHFEGRVALVAAPNAVEHLPERIIEVFGPPRCTSTGHEIMAAIEDA